MDNKIIYWNKFAEVLYQWKAKEVLNKKITDVIIPPINKAYVKQILLKARKKGKWEGELEVVKKNNESFLIHFAISSLKSGKNKVVGTVNISTDITERKQIEQEIRYLAGHDPLTQLPNRTLLNEGFTEAMQDAKLNEKMLAVLFIDLDRFKFINDTLGHILGDKLLKIIADRMKFAMRPSDILARIGGDEFMILLKDVTEVDEVTGIANRILGAFEPVFYLDGHEIHITASIGISLYPHDGQDVQELLKNADSAMYRAKEQGKNNYELYSPVLNEKAMEKLMLQNSLQNALARNEFIIYYQPIVNTKTKNIVGLEALMRWKHPKLGIIPPSDFIPLAEETGIILPMTEWILKKVCSQCKEWHEKGYKDLYVAVNLSSQHFNKKNWDKMILEALSESKLKPSSLELEINENSIMKNAPQTIKVINSLRQKGIKFSIDDFGTGYSSLSYLTQFPIDGLKIDQSFMRFITTDSDDAAIITAIVYMAHNLNLRVTAEGIENSDQLKFMDSIDCDYAHGYYFSRPVPKDEIDKLLTKSFA
jgi:diguanylate cyclase (GGDEF)-like protein/PAS domain S-box-containing protein